MFGRARAPTAPGARTAPGTWSRPRAIAFLAKEFAPVRAVAPDDGKRDLIAKLRQALEAGAENAEIELEVVRTGSAAEEEAGRKEDAQ